MTANSVSSLDPATFETHALHRMDRAWVESNCYVDLWIELLHALKQEPFACLAFTVTTDFEGDQFTFFKPPIADLERLYGIEIQELDLWRTLSEHVNHQVELGRIVLVEVDAFHLPDTAGTDYRSQHTKTTIGIETIDLTKRRLGYFHNAGYFALEGEDFDGILRMKEGPATELPPYAEIVKLDRATRRPSTALVAEARTLLSKHLSRRPRRNPIAAYGTRVAQDIDWLVHQDLATYHRYAFATIRQCGANFELSASFLRWLAAAHPESPASATLSTAAGAFDTIAQSAKALILKMARIAHTRRPFDPSPTLTEMAACWDSGMQQLDTLHDL